MKNMKRRLILLMLICICGCNNRERELSISIEKINQHPFLVDHGRLLVVKAGDQVVDSLEIYPDGGDGSDLHYFVMENQIIAIDCNGIWYQITQQGIKVIGWKWDEELPEGTIYRITLNENGKCESQLLENVSLSRVYISKDPGEYY